VLLGTVFPLLYEAVNGGQVTVGTPYFATVAVPMSIVLLVLMSLAPLVGWRTLDASVLWSRVRFSAWTSLFVVVALTWAR
jgi:cytochrome c-type biogenesis protein CcmF